jgi:mRNA interferase RelE/StbE
MEQRLYKLVIPDGAAKLIRGLHPHLKQKIKGSLKIILANPQAGKALKDELEGLRSFRVSRFRVIYRVQRRRVEVIAIGPRKRIYEETFLLLNKEKRERR